MLSDLLDRHMAELDITAIIYSTQAEAAERHADFCERQADWIASGRMPKQWLVHLGTLLGVDTKTAAAIVQQFEAEGKPPARHAYLLSYQITAALMRGHQLAGVYATDDKDQDEDDEDDDEDEDKDMVLVPRAKLDELADLIEQSQHLLTQVIRQYFQP